MSEPERNREDHSGGSGTHGVLAHHEDIAALGLMDLPDEALVHISLFLDRKSLWSVWRTNTRLSGLRHDTARERLRRLTQGNLDLMKRWLKNVFLFF